MRKININYTSTEPFTETQLVDGLSNALSLSCAFYLHDCDSKAYANARQELIAEGADPAFICLEEIYVRMLLNGGTLRLLEDSDENVWHEITLDKFVEGIAKAVQAYHWKSAEDMLENGDAADWESVLQFAAFGEVVYG